jgi:hypothetical protein
MTLHFENNKRHFGCTGFQAVPGNFLVKLGFRKRNALKNEEGKVMRSGTL